MRKASDIHKALRTILCPMCRGTHHEGYLSAQNCNAPDCPMHCEHVHLTCDEGHEYFVIVNDEEPYDDTVN